MILNKNDGTSEEVEIVMTFKLEKFDNSDYVIYKSNEKYYAAKFIEKNGFTDLITNLSEEERKALSEMFNKLNKGGII